MAKEQFVKGIRYFLHHEPTVGQQMVIDKLADFLTSRSQHPTFLLKGFAGTGKTSLISALVKTLPRFNLKYTLLAPTGRAAKVLANYSGSAAYTIHKKIYRQKKGDLGGLHFSLQKNNTANTIFIVDEASMISDESNEWGTKRGLLEDLISYVHAGKNCKLIIIGDTAQLPPVNASESPALNEAYLSSAFDISLQSAMLKEVVRQQQHSGILDNATQVRTLIDKGVEEIPRLITAGYKDMYRMTGERLEDGVNYAYNKFGIEDCMIVCRSNKQAYQYNQHIRNRILYREEEVSAGDYLMVVKNNYFWLPDSSDGAFIANGDIAEVLKVRRYHDLYGFRFAEVSLRLLDYPNEPALETTIMLDTLSIDAPALPYEQSKQLFEEVLLDYQDELTKSKQIEKVKNNPFFNALQVKFAYAVTCHKAQGGQWSCVFVDQGYMTEEMVNTDYLRWLYTAMTRATEELFMVNFHESFYAK